MEKASHSLSNKWTYVEPVGDGDFSPVYITLTEQEILDRYWDYWYNAVLKSKGKKFADTMTEQDCVQDFVIIHWAWPTD